MGHRYDADADIGRYDFNRVSALCEAERCVRDNTGITILLSGISDPNLRWQSSFANSFADKTRIIGRFCALQDLYVGAWSLAEILMAKYAMEWMENGGGGRVPRSCAAMANGIGWLLDDDGKLKVTCDWYDDWSVLKVTRALASSDVYGTKYLKGRVYEGIQVCAAPGLHPVRA